MIWGISFKLKGERMSLQNKRFFGVIFLIIFMLISFTVPASARWGDGAGPAGLGQKTGRLAGYCVGYSVPGFQNTTVPRRGYRRTSFQGGGRGFRNIYNATGLFGYQRGTTTLPAVTTSPAATTPPVFTKEQQLEALKKQAEYLKNELGKITRQINTADSEKGQE